MIGVLLGGLAAGACASDDFQPEGGAGDAGSGAVSSVDSGTAGSAGSPGNPDGDPAGSACTDGTTCKSGFCADGVCCDTKCDGVCESCAVEGSVGTCTPFAESTDPEAECTGGSEADSACAGTCNGASACAFPGAERSCGANGCSDNTQIGMACDGKGGCASAEIDCAPYVCDVSACTTSCQTDADCAESGWCNAGSCHSKGQNGDKCGSDAQCESNRCAGGYCCAGSCAAPNSCETGECRCGGVVCGAGATCETFWLDADGDGFGAPSELDVVACSNQPPAVPGKKYVLAKGAKADCFDSNKNAFPGQTEYFGVHRGDGSFDYDCNAKQEKQYKEVPATLACKTCIFSPTLFSCLPGYECGSGGYGVAYSKAFKQPVACGAQGTLGSCSLDGACGAKQTTSYAQQLCR